MEPDSQPDSNNSNPIPNKLSPLKESLVGFLVISSSYWLVYTYFNWSFRIGDGSGISALPQPQNPSQFLIILFGAIGALLLWQLYLAAKHNNRPNRAKYILSLPALLIVLSTAVGFISGATCSGYLCNVGAALTAFFAVVSFIGIYISFFLSLLAVTLTNKIRFGFELLIFLSATVFVLPIFLPIILNKQQDMVVINNEVTISALNLKTESISKEIYDKAQKYKLDNCCTVLENRFSGAVVLSKLGDDKHLLQGPVTKDQADPENTELWSTDLFVEENGKQINITNGVDFETFTFGQKGSGTRPIFINNSKTTAAFFQEYLIGGDFIVVKLDASGAYVSSSDCNVCTVMWGADDYIYTQEKLDVNDPTRDQYWRVPAP